VYGVFKIICMLLNEQPPDNRARLEKLSRALNTLIVISRARKNCMHDVCPCLDF
jgi:hypothetical protein